MFISFFGRNRLINKLAELIKIEQTTPYPHSYYGKSNIPGVSPTKQN
jgi:hypothetical protein